MKISTLALPFLLLAPGIAHAASDLLSGTVRVGTGELLPITKLRAEIWACSPGIFRWCTWSYVVSINTDESGSFRYTSSPNVPPNTSWSIHLVGANDAAEFNDGGWFGWAPSLVTPIPLGGGGREVFFNTVITDTTWSARLKNLEVIRTGRMYANSNRDPREGDPIPIVSRRLRRVSRVSAAVSFHQQLHWPAAFGALRRARGPSGARGL